MSTNIKTNQLNDAIDIELKFYSSNNLANNPVKDTPPIVTISLRGRNKYKETLNLGITFLWGIGSTNIMINCKHIKNYKSKIRSNKV